MSLLQLKLNQAIVKAIKSTMFKDFCHSSARYELQFETVSFVVNNVSKMRSKAEAGILLILL